MRKHLNTLFVTYGRHRLVSVLAVGLLCLAAVTGRAYANESIVNEMQTSTVTGRVVDAAGNPIAGALILEAGGTRTVITNNDGAFSIAVQGTAILRVSLIGYITREVPVDGQSNLRITLAEDTQVLDDVIVVGYGTQRKLTSTAAVGTVSSEQLAKTSMVNTAKALTGLTAGITIIDRGGAPGGDDPTIYIRGVGTNGHSDPLVLVDGVEMSLNMVPSTEVESISILKDAASASIYGSRAAHGVILVTTKRGKTGKPTISYNGYVGIQDLATVPRQVTAQEYMDMVNESSTNKGGTPIYTDAIQKSVLAGTDGYGYHNWYREMYQPSVLAEHTLSLSGGMPGVTYSSMFNYMDQDGVIKNTNFKRYTYSGNMDVEISKYFRFSSNLSYRHSDRNWPSLLGDVQRTAISFVPTNPGYWDDGRYKLDDQNQNPIAYGDPDTVGKQILQRDNITGQAKIEFEPIEDLVFTGQVSLNGRWDREKRHYKSARFYGADGTSLITTWNNPNRVEDLRNNRYQLKLSFLADYSTTFGDDHYFHVLAGAEQESFRNFYSRAERRNLISDALPDVSLGSASNQYADGYPEMWGINSYFGRVNYTYRDKYLFEANVRADGSSKFAKGSKWGVFPSFSAGWRISEEAFMRDATWVSNLKLRASWGHTGNETVRSSVGRFLYMPQYGSENVVMNGVFATGVNQSKMATPDLTWETAVQTDIGLDFGFLNNRLFGEIDYFIKDTRDVLLNLGIPRFIGLDAPYRNVGTIRNNGIEMMLGFRDESRAFKYSVTGNLSYIKNRWTDRQGDNNNTHDYNIERTGEELNAFYMYAADGLIANQAELDKYVADHKADPRGIKVLRPGDVKLIDTDGDGTITPDDRQIFSSNVPNFIYSLSFNAEYKGFDLSLQFQGTAGANKFIYGEIMEGPCYEAFTGLHYRERWTIENENPNALVPRLEGANNRNNSTINSFFLKDVSYIRLKNAQIGYTLPASISSKMKMSNARIYISGSNLLTLKSIFQSLDPEQTSGRETNWPALKIVSLGLNLTF
jgi:TonB-linked SusC/RagA family outer membrane protein